MTRYDSESSHHNAQNQVVFGTLVKVDDAQGEQSLTIEGLKDEKIEGLQRVQQFGFSSTPSEGDVVAIFADGGRKHGVVLNVGGRAYRMKADGGGVRVYDESGSYVHLKNGDMEIESTGKVNVKSAATTTVESGGHLEIIAPSVNIKSSTLTHNGVNIGDTHKHKNVMPGPSLTGLPT